MNTSKSSTRSPVSFTDSLALMSRRLSRQKGRKLAQLLFRYFPAKHGSTLIRDFDGDLQMALDRGSLISSAIYWSGHHSLELIRFLDGFLAPDMTVVDIGANIGEVTLYAAKRLTRGRVLSFEPMPAVFSQLARNVALNHFSSVELFNIGLYDEERSLPLYVKADRAFGIVNEGVSSLFQSSGETTRASVQLRKLDNLVREHNLQRLDFLKVDVEGAEWMVLKGAEHALRQFRPVIVAESSALNFARARYRPEDLYRYLVGLGYEIRSLEDGSTNLPAECDILCVPSAPMRMS